MEAVTLKPSPFPSANEVPLHRNPPLAPSQEMAYRNKCIQLKRRLTEIELNNDATRKRITIERERIQKMRFMRAVLLNQLQQIMSTPGKKLTTEQLERLGIADVTVLPDTGDRLEGEGLLDASSDESEDEDGPEPSERPTRTRRNNNNNYREIIMNTNSVNNAHATSYDQPNLPSLAPTNSYSPMAPRESLPHTSSIHMASTPLAAGSPPYSRHSVQQQYPQETRYPQQSSPLQHHQILQQDHTRTRDMMSDMNGVASKTPPVRPEPPSNQFHTHMRPQLEADKYPADQIDARIEEEWRKLSDDNRGLWEQRYEEQMVDYQESMDHYNRAKRRAGERR